MTTFCVITIVYTYLLRYSHFTHKYIHTGENNRHCVHTFVHHTLPPYLSMMIGRMLSHRPSQLSYLYLSLVIPLEASEQNFPLAWFQTWDFDQCTINFCMQTPVIYVYYTYSSMYFWKIKLVCKLQGYRGCPVE